MCPDDPLYNGEERRKISSCPLTPGELKRLADNQDRLVEQMATIQKYLFAGRVTMGVLVGIAMSFEWVREHAQLFKDWIRGD